MTIQEILTEHRPSRWRSFTNENEILRCCGKDFGNATKKAKRGDEHLAWTEFSAHVAEVLEKHMQEREAGALESFVASQRQMLENMETFADEYDRDEVDRWCSVITNRAKEIRELTNGR